MTATSSFCAFAVHDGRAHDHAVEAESFTDAALQFVEVWRPEPDEGEAVRIVVRDQASGEEQCFVVELGLADVQPCEEGRLAS